MFARSIAVALLAVLALSVGPAVAQTFTENFNRAALGTGGPANVTYSGPTTLTYSGTPATSSGALVTGSGSPNNFGNMLQFTSGAIPASSTGAVYVTGTMSGAGFNPNLTQNNATWTFNMKSDVALGGFGTGVNGQSAYGIATILAADSNNLATANGYAVIVGRQGNSDRVQLVQFSAANGGLANIANTTTIVTGSGNVGRLGTTTDYASYRVTYTAATNTWSLAFRDDGTSAWTDPATGTFTTIGSAPDNPAALPNGANLANYGFYFNYGATNTAQTAQTANFDNFQAVFTPVPEPASVMAVACCGLGLVAGVRRRFGRTQLA